MNTDPIPVIVADDFERFRRYLCSALLKRPEVQVVGEISDGLEAVQKVQEMQPGLLILDIHLPGLNGIEAARRIRELAPRTKILFVSQEQAVEVMEEAFKAGASGYVVKTDAPMELLIAVDVVLRGDRFASHRFAHLLNGTDMETNLRA